ncbi:MAG: PVC-type heme-binding CxxCH protein [Roseibacillus sp.]
MDNLSRLTSTARSYCLATCLFLLTSVLAKAADSSGKNSILFYGNSMIERLLEHGELEARLQLAAPEAGLKVRSLAWTGDEVGHRLRLEGYAKHMKNLLQEWPSDTIVLGYGLNESFGGEEGLEDFRAQYGVHLDQLSHLHPNARFVLLSPIAIEGASAERQAEVGMYSQAIAQLAKERGAEFVDLFSATQKRYQELEAPLTNNGIHLSDLGNHHVARVIAEALVGSATQEMDKSRIEELKLAVAAKHKRVAEVVRPKNAVVYFGVRARSKEYNEEMPRYHEMIRLTEEVVHRMAKDSTLNFADIEKPSLPPLPPRKGKDDGARTGIIKPPSEAMAEFTVADDFEVNLFASEEQFPELRNPVQISFDARGRLWVVTMPSFPHTVPGLTPPDRIVILEDTDKDGRADKITTFMDGLDALDGVAFHRDGVIVSEQPRLWLMKDTDGDDRADTQVELLRGIDVTDSHHGGMITTDPFGDVIFCDGVFHRSQLETPMGVHRGIDATTYRLDMKDGGIVTEWQHTTPNPWKVTFNRWGGIFQNYGDGHAYDGTALIWTPLGGYHPFGYANIATYGKGSGLTIVSSPNFPERYQQGMASAALLGRYAVTLTAFESKNGFNRKKDPLTIVSSPNAAFRPADLEFGMDGALYISDFCSPIIGHAQHPMRSPHWDHDFGRIWRVVYSKGSLAKDWPQIEGASLKALCSLLVHPQDLVRKHARIELRKQGSQGMGAVNDWLAAFDKEDENYEQAVLETIFVGEGLGVVQPDLLKVLLRSKLALYRGAAVQAIRIQADELPDLVGLLSFVETETNPRVQIEVIDAVAHLRPNYPEVETVLANLKPLTKDVESSLSYLDLGIEPLKGRSVPVLEVDKNSRMTHWLFLGEKGDAVPTELATEGKPLPGVGLFRTFVQADEPTTAIIAIKHMSIDIRLNDRLVFSQDSLWSGDQQVNVELEKGLNTIEILLKSGRRKTKTMPPAYLYDPVGQEVAGVQYSKSFDELEGFAEEYEEMVAERGNVVRVQAAAGLQFAPKEVRVTPGSKVRLIFENPDIMPHNWVLIAPGSVEEMGALADKLAGQADGAEKEYLPESAKILQASKLLSTKQEQELVFEAPTEPGVYPYICTFPGHWRVMQGSLIVEELKTVEEKKATTKNLGEGVFFETAANASEFNQLVPKKSKGTVMTNQKTSNDSPKVLTDGRLEEGYGPVFGNGITDGAYKLDLGKKKSISAMTSWSHNEGGRRGHQSVRLYGSADEKDPGWDLTNAERFVPLGVLKSGKESLEAFSALSLRAPKGESLGEFRWIVWQVSPAKNPKENTAFQELGVEVSSN